MAKENKQAIKVFALLFLTIFLISAGVPQWVGNKVSGFLSPAIEDLDMNGFDIKMGAGLIGFDGTASEGWSFDTSGNITFEATAGSLLLPSSNDAVTPTLSFGTGVGLYRETANLNIAIAGTKRFYISTAGIVGEATNAGLLYNRTPSGTDPGFTFSGDINTGIGTAGADILSLTAGAEEGIRITEGTNILTTNIKGSQIVNVTAVASGTHTVLQTDYYLQVTYTATGVVTITLPSIATVGNGFIIVIKDSGYNANTNNITVARNGSDSINNVGGNYTINNDGAAIALIANSTTSDWEIW